MSSRMSRELELVEAEAQASAYAACPADLAWEHGIEARTIAGAACVTVGALSTVTMLNRVTGLGLRKPASEEALVEIERFYEDRGLRHAIALSPDAEPPELRDWLAARRYEPGYAWAKFRRGVDDVPEVETELDVRLAGPKDGPAFADVVRRAYGMPDVLAGWLAAIPGVQGWSCYLSWAGDQPAGAGALFVGGDRGWLGFAGTVPEHRRKGSQGAIMAARIRRAAELGVTTLATETGELVSDRPSSSYRNILRFGFEQLYVRPNYDSPA